MSKITAISGRILYNSRGSKTIEVDVVTDGKFLGRVCAPSGASVGKFEAVSFPNNDPEKSLSILNENSNKFIGSDSSDLKQVHDVIHSIDGTDNYAKIGGACAFAITIAATESAAKFESKQFFQMISNKSNLKFPFKIERLSSGLLLGKLTASNLPTLAPDGAQTLPRNFSSVVISTSIVLLPLLLYRIRPEIAVIFDNLF